MKTVIYAQMSFRSDAVHVTRSIFATTGRKDGQLKTGGRNGVFNLTYC